METCSVTAEAKDVNAALCFLSKEDVCFCKASFM